MNDKKSVRELVVKLRKMGINASLSKPRGIMVKNEKTFNVHKPKGVN
jgi:hypothetical protein